MGFATLCTRLFLSLSARRAWIEIIHIITGDGKHAVALRKESVDRNTLSGVSMDCQKVALRKESVDRNTGLANILAIAGVALRKESVDRNVDASLLKASKTVALRKESVDRNAAISLIYQQAKGRSPQGERG